MFIFLSYTQDSAAHGSLGTEFPCTLSFLFLDNMLVRLFRSVSQSFWLEEQLLSSGFAGDTDGVNKRALVNPCIMLRKKYVYYVAGHFDPYCLKAHKTVKNEVKPIITLF